MTPAEKRKFIRLDSLHLLDYLVVDIDGVERDYSMARTLDVSINGIKIETLSEIPINASLVITLGIEEELVDIEGRATHSHKIDNRFITGVEFLKVNSPDRLVLRQYVDAFQERKAKLLQQDDFPAQEQTI